MSSSNKISNLENSLPLVGQENNDCDKEKTSEFNSEAEKENKIRNKTRENRKYLNKMLYLIKEFLIMVLVVITYAAITNDPPKIGKSPAAYRFFPKNSYVTDWYRGELSQAINQARSGDFAFVMFYAPWDAECQHARKEFQMVARYMHHQVTFSAVNCWQPGSECRNQYPKVKKWPILIAYPTHGRGVQYNGPLIYVYMVQFLKKLISPFNRIELVHSKMWSQYDAIIVGKMNALPYSREYGVFYQMTLRLLEKDPLQEIGVSIVTCPPFDEDGIQNEPVLSLYMWNETLIYPSYRSEWDIEPLLEWIVKHVHQVTTWITPSGTKSLSLANHLQPGPALILFTPKNPLAIHNDFYSMLRDIGHDYNYCGDNNLIYMMKLIINTERREKYLDHLRMYEECSMRKFKVRPISTPNLWSNVSYCLEKQQSTDSSFAAENSMVHYYGGIDVVCQKLLQNLNTRETKKCVNIEEQVFSYKTSMLMASQDYRSSENLRKVWYEEKCRTFQIAQKYQTLAFSPELYRVRSFDKSNFTGLKCRTNKTLSLISMDSLYYHHYAEKLGVDLSRKRNRTAVVILDDKMESHYVMAENVTETNLKNFIYNYTQGSLTRALTSSTNLISKNTHSYPNKGECHIDSAKFCVKELSSSNFLETISQINKAVILFYYSKQCSFCNGISYRFLTVAKYFSSMDDFLFARIDGDLNLLPWEYTMNVYPTILFVPPNRVSESRVFPMEMQITVPNLIRFLLANLQPALKLQAMWTLCERTVFYPNHTQCSSSLRLQTSSVIDKVLHDWRHSFTNEEKSIQFYKLQRLHDLYSLFLQYPHNATLAEYHFTRLKLIEMQPAETPV